MSAYSPHCILLTNFAGKAWSPSPIMKGGLDSCDLASSKLGSADLGSSSVAPLVASFLPTVVLACLAPTSWAGMGFSFPIVARPNSSMVEALACHRDHWFLPNLGKGGSCNITPQINHSETQAAVVRSPIFWGFLFLFFVFLPRGPFSLALRAAAFPPCRQLSPAMRADIFFFPPCGQLSPAMQVIFLPLCGCHLFPALRAAFSHHVRADVYPSCGQLSCVGPLRPVLRGIFSPPCGKLSHHMGYFLPPSGASSSRPVGCCLLPCGQLSYHVGYFLPPYGRLFPAMQVAVTHHAGTFLPPCGRLSPCRAGRCLPPCGQLSPTMWVTFSPPCRQLSSTMWATFSPPCGSLSSAMRAPFCHRVGYFLPSCERLLPAMQVTVFRHAGNFLTSSRSSFSRHTGRPFPAMR